MRSGASGYLYAVACLGAGLLGCDVVPADRFIELQVRREGQDVVFDSPEIADTCPNGILVSGLGVSEESCEQDCERWLVARSRRPSTSDPLIRLPVRYGMDISGLEERVRAQELEPGPYLVAGEFGCYVDGELWGSLVVGGFEVLETGAIVSSKEAL